MKTSREWAPQLESSRGSWASRLAEAIAADVASGRLAPGDRLPTQRALARQLGVTTGTVNRAFALAERAGLVTAEVGRGTFVAAPMGTDIVDTSLAREASGAIELGLNYPAGVEANRVLGETLARMAHGEPRAATDLLSLAPYAGRLTHRAAGARWLRRVGVAVGADDVVVCTSVQHGLAAAFAALIAPGDVVLTESLTSPGMKALAAMHHLRLVPVAGDDRGLMPDALASACRATSARVLYTMPTLHTPTTTTMPDERRRAIADVLRTHALMAIEDDAWGFLADGAVTPLRALAPDAVIYVTSVSKSLAPGLRVGFMVPPAALLRAVTSCIGALTWTAPLMADIVARWIDDGTAVSIAEQRTRTARERQRLAVSVLGAAVTPSALPAYHLWVTLPEPWRVSELVAQAATRGVSLAHTDAFVPGRAPTPHAVRLCTGTEPNVRRVEEGLRLVAQMLASGPASYAVTAGL